MLGPTVDACLSLSVSLSLSFSISLVFSLSLSLSHPSLSRASACNCETSAVAPKRQRFLLYCQKMSSSNAHVLVCQDTSARKSNGSNVIPRRACSGLGSHTMGAQGAGRKAATLLLRAQGDPPLLCTRSLCLSLSLSLSLSFFLLLSLFFSLSPTHTYSLFYLSLPHTHTYTHTLSLSLSLGVSFSPSLPCSCRERFPNAGIWPGVADLQRCGMDLASVCIPHTEVPCS